jgi:hypothetical protein
VIPVEAVNCIGGLNNHKLSNILKMSAIFLNFLSDGGLWLLMPKPKKSMFINDFMNCYDECRHFIGIRGSELIGIF